MAKKAYIGVDGKARKIKKGYIGVDGKARKIKKAYIGIGGVARPCWSGGVPAYYGKLTPLNTAKVRLASASVKNHALFAGGQDSVYNILNTVDSYDGSLTKGMAPTLSPARYNLGGASCGEYAYFACGYNSYFQNAVERFNSSLTKTNATGALQSADRLASLSFKQYAMFAGGLYSDDEGYSLYSNACSIYDSSTTRRNGTLNWAVYGLAGAQVGDYAVFSGGYSGGKINKVQYFNTSFTCSYTTDLTVARMSHSGASIGNYALFAGGEQISGNTNTVEAYNSSLTKTSATALSNDRKSMASAVLGDYAIFASGISNSSGISPLVDMYDKSLTRTVATSLAVGRFEFTGTTLNNYAIFAGGCTVKSTTGRDTFTNEVEAYILA